MSKFFVSIVMTLCALSPGDVPGQTDEDWVLVNPRELREADEWRRHADAAFARVALDMNGDKLGDEAALVVSRSGKRSGVRICLSVKPSHAGEQAGVSCHVVAENEDIHAVMGLGKRAPGCYEFYESDTTRSKGQVCSEFEVLEYFRFASAGSFFVYSKVDGAVGRYWDAQ